MQDQNTATQDERREATAAPGAPTSFQPTPGVASLEPAKVRGAVELIRILAQHPEHAPYLKQLIEAEAQRDIFDNDYRMARVFAISGKFDDIKGSTPEQAVATAMAKIRIGREWGMNESDSIAFIYFVNGRPAVMTEILATKIQQAGYSWDVEWHGADKDPQRCVGCTLYLKAYDRATNRYAPVLDRNEQPVSASFMRADAEQAGLLSKPGPWKAWAQEMYFWRALARLRKFYLTGVMRGATQVELVDDYQEQRPQLLPAVETAGDEPMERRALRDKILGHSGFGEPSPGETFELLPETPTTAQREKP